MYIQCIMYEETELFGMNSCIGETTYHNCSLTMLECDYVLANVYEATEQCKKCRNSLNQSSPYPIVVEPIRTKS